MGNPVFLDLHRGEADPILQNVGVSVVIPTHNRLADLDIAVASVLEQGVECEIIVVDDGSEPRVAPVGSLKDDAVQIIRNDIPVGPCRARAQGIERARGAYIAFLDDDDIWLPEKLSRSLRVIAEKPEARVVVHRTGFDLRQVSDTPGVAKIEENPLHRYGRERTPHLNSVLVEAELAASVGFDENFFACSDIDFVIGLARRSSFAMIDDVLALRGKDTAPSAIAIERRIEGRGLLTKKHPDVFNVDPESKAFQDVRLAHLYRRNGHRVKALGGFARALIRQPTNTDAWHGAGITIIPSETGKTLSIRKRLKAVPIQPSSMNGSTDDAMRTRASDKKMLPTYIIAGAMRSGTTALNSYLRQHPEVGVSSNKETHFFDRNFERGLDWYRSLFPDEGNFRAIGEATPNYMFSTLALDRLRETLPDVKLVLILRNPVDRAYSHYWHDRVRNKVSMEFDEIVQAEMDGNVSDGDYLARGLYRQQIDEVLERFPRESVLIQIFEDMADNPREVYSAVCRFIGVDDRFTPDGLGDPVNKYIEFRSLTARNWSRHLPGRARNLVGLVNTKRTERYPKMDPKTRERLQEYFADSNRALADIIDVVPPWDSNLESHQRVTETTEYE